jgi:hypothetical protein
MDLLAELNLDVTTDGKRYGNLININPISIDPRLGTELNYNKTIFVRAGLGNFQQILDDRDTTNQDKTLLFQPTLGLGVRIKNLAIDYSFSSLNLRDNALYSHFVSLRIDIQKKGHSETDDDEAFNSKAQEINRNLKKSKKQTP